MPTISRADGSRRLATALVAGASMGGMVRSPSRRSIPSVPRALGLIDTTAWYGPDAAKSWAERADKAIARRARVACAVSMTTRWFGDAFRAEHADVVKRCIEVFLRNDIGAYGRGLPMLGRATCARRFPAQDAGPRSWSAEEDYRGLRPRWRGAQSGIAVLDLQRC